jgi:hypothetical protein
MFGVQSGARVYRVFVCHRYKDDEQFGQLRTALNKVKYFRWEHVGVPAEKRLTFSDKGLKASIASKIKNADIMLVLAHSAGNWVEHEIEKAQQYGVPIVAVIDPQRVATPHVWAITSQVRKASVTEVSLGSIDEIIAAIKKHARQKITTSKPAKGAPSDAPTVKGDRLAVEKPADIAANLSSVGRRAGIFSTIGRYLFPNYSKGSVTERRR